jgi:hypothetical protein
MCSGVTFNLQPRTTKGAQSGIAHVTRTSIEHRVPCLGTSILDTSVVTALTRDGASRCDKKQREKYQADKTTNQSLSINLPVKALLVHENSYRRYIRVHRNIVVCVRARCWRVQGMYGIHNAGYGTLAQ